MSHVDDHPNIIDVTRELMQSQQTATAGELASSGPLMTPTGPNSTRSSSLSDTSIESHLVPTTGTQTVYTGDTDDLLSFVLDSLPVDGLAVSTGANKMIQVRI